MAIVFIVFVVAMGVVHPWMMVWPKGHFLVQGMQSSPAVGMHKVADILSDILDFLSFAAAYTHRNILLTNMNR